jgi:protocatechuate 3,4-dioxygenase beta subunit
LGAVGGESCLIKNGGPADVNVELLSSDGSEDPVASVLTSSDGSYLFKNIIPGTYNIRASHPELQVEVRGSTEVELGFANGMVDDIFFVLGYDLKGSVVAQGNPILGVHIYLHSDDVSMVDCPQGSGDAAGERKSLCHAVSDAEGIFSFKSIPCGKYELVPHYKGENTVFDVSPPVMPVSVEHQHVTVPQKFQVTGFSIGGRVVDGNSVGVEGVKILVDGSLRSVTDKEGYYKLDQVYVNAIFNLNLYHIPCSSCKPAKLVVTQPLLVNFLRLLESRVKNMARFLKVMY